MRRWVGFYSLARLYSSALPLWTAGRALLPRQCRSSLGELYAGRSADSWLAEALLLGSGAVEEGVHRGHPSHPTPVLPQRCRQRTPAELTQLRGARRLFYRPAAVPRRKACLQEADPSRGHPSHPCFAQRCRQRTPAEPTRGCVLMPTWPEQDLATFLANLLLPAVCLYSAIRTFQINRGAAAGFFLQALGPLLETVPFGPRWQGARPPDHSWPCTVVGLPLLAFGFHWLNGDCFTANILLGGALMLAGGWGYFTEDGKAMVAHSVVSVVTITIFIVSVFTGSAYGVVGSLMLAAAGLLPGTGLWPLLASKETDALLRCLMAAANLALCRALQLQHLELGNSYREWLPIVAS